MRSWRSSRIAPDRPSLPVVSLPLAGRNIVVTRPRAQAKELAAGIEAAGGNAILFPLLEIAPLPDNAPLDAAVGRLDEASLAIFISVNAVDFSVAAIRARRSWPSTLAVAAVGQGTARALRAEGFAEVILPPTQFDSEGLLALPELAASAVRGRLVLLFKGEGGRDLLAATLAERGGEVLPVPCYKRLPPVADSGMLRELFATDRLDAIVVSSSEAMRHLGKLLLDDVPADGCEIGRRLLDQTLIVVPHPRIAEEAARFCRRIQLTPPGDAGMLAGLSAYNWPSAPSQKS
jgi:uroporphyrinogen-III synthase